MKRRLLNRLAVGANVECGENFHAGLGTRIWAPRRLTVGRDVYCGRFVTIELDGMIGDGVLIANNVGIIGRKDHDIRQVGHIIRHADWVGDEPERLSLPTEIGSDVWIGYGAVVLSGVCVGNSAIIGSGTLVRHDIPANTIWQGNPARFVGYRFSERDFGAHWSMLKSRGYTPR